VGSAAAVVHFRFTDVPMAIASLHDLHGLLGAENKMLRQTRNVCFLYRVVLDVQVSILWLDEVVHLFVVQLQEQKLLG
jgi:hypothetical protein